MTSPVDSNDDDDDELSPETKDRLQEDIVEHLKKSGAFDSIRMALLEDIWNDPYYKEEIVIKFIAECESFCEQADLSLARNTLRIKLTDKFENFYSTSKRRVSSHIDKILERKRHEIESRFSHHAENFLSQFLPKSDPSPDQDEHELDEEEKMVINDDVVVKVEPRTEHNANEPDYISPEHGIPDASGSPQKLIEVLLEHSNNVEKSELNSIPKTPETPPVQQQAVTPTPDIEIEIENAQAESDMDVDSNDDIERPPFSPIGVSQEKAEDAKESNDSQDVEDFMDANDAKDGEVTGEAEDVEFTWTFSSVSSVNTADLSDFEETIKLSDDEAEIVDRPRNSKVPIRIIQDIIELKKREPCDTSEPDLSATESVSNEGRRQSRTRRSNPRYNNENFIA